jgi:hypothetical protein
MGVFSRRLLLNLLLRKSTHTNLQSFTLFPKLPAELRIQIWELALEPRVVKLEEHHTPRIFWDKVRDVTQKLHLVAIGDKPPCHLQVSREARSIVLKHHLSLWTPINPSRSLVYFNYAQDTLQGEIRQFKEWMHKMSRHDDDIKKIKHIKIPFGCVMWHSWDSAWETKQRVQFLTPFTGLETIVFSSIFVGLPSWWSYVDEEYINSCLRKSLERVFTRYKIEWIKKSLLDDLCRTEVSVKISLGTNDC